MSISHVIIDSPVGELTLTSRDGALTGLYFADHVRRPPAVALGGQDYITREYRGPNKTRGRDDTGPHDAGSRDAVGTRDDSGVHGVFREAARQLEEYFAGERTGFDLPLAPVGDAFQLKVWMLLRDIPYGQTRSYGRLAEQLGDRNLARAVGAANGRNPLSVVVPCHRVVGADGNLVGYAGGLDRKRFLLGLEEPAAARAAKLF